MNLIRLWPVPLLLLSAITGCRTDDRIVSGSAPATTAVEEPEPTPQPFGKWDPSYGFGTPINTAFRGVTCFRGNPQRNYYGEGPIPTGQVEVLWRSSIGVLPSGHWSGVGWTGQPLIVEWPEDVRPHMNFLEEGGPEREIIVGALDGQVHFFDAETGERSRKPLPVPSPRYPIKGTVSVDPRGYPLLYVGCGINSGKPGYRIYSLLDFKELLYMPAYEPQAQRRWAGSDSNALVLNDTLFLPAENALFYKVKLNAVWSPDAGEISIAPEIERQPIGTQGTENSMAVWGDYGFFADNRGTLRKVTLDDISQVETLTELGDDTDSTISFDSEGNFYVGIEVDKRAGKGGKGGIYKYDQSGKRLWKWEFQAGSYMGGGGKNPINGGILSSAAISEEDGLVYYTTSHHPRLGQGYLVALEMGTGKLRWKLQLRGFAWSSPIYSRGVVFAADSTGTAYIVDSKTGETLLIDSEGAAVPSMNLGANVESSPIVWEGRVYVGIRGGAMVCIGIKPVE